MRMISRRQQMMAQARLTAADELGARFVRIDVTNDGSAPAAATDAERHERHHRCTEQPRPGPGIYGDLTGADVRGGPHHHGLPPALRRSADPVIINVSSSMGSLAATRDPARAESGVIVLAYTSPQVALNILTIQYVKALIDIWINAADPGYTATDFNGNNGPQPVTDGTDAAVGLATEGSTHGSGRFVDRDRGDHPVLARWPICLSTV